MSDKKTKVETTPAIDPIKMVDELAAKAQVALNTMLDLTQEQVDEIVKAMALAGLSNQMHLARMAVEETGRGIFEDKVTKNIFSTEYIYHSIKYDKTVGIIEDSDDEAYMVVAEPVGVVAGVTPVTNPTSTTMFKAIISLKTRNPIIFGFHPSAQKCSTEAARIVRDAAIKAGAPENCVQWIEHPSIEATNALMNHPTVALVLATGGSAMVRAAYSTGKPALGVGPGNVPAFIEKTAVVERAVNDIILSKSFDNGMICASEQAAIIEAPIYDKAVALMKAQGCYFATKEEIKKIEPVVINLEKGMVNAAIVGKYPYEIAAMAGITIPKETKILCCEIEGAGPEYPLSREKLSPVLAVIKAKDVNDGITKAEIMVEMGGLGHTSAVHSTDDNVINEFARRLKTGRIVVNVGLSLLLFTVACGNRGAVNSTSTTNNLTSEHIAHTGTEDKEASVVYMIEAITPEALIQIYEALGKSAQGNVAVKLHMGEIGGNYYLQPSLISDFIKHVEGTIVECNTVDYGNARATTAMHKQVAADHGFTAIAEVDIMDEDGYMSLPVVGGKNLEENFVGKNLANYDSVIILSHFKGHQAGGFGGAIKNTSIGDRKSVV